MIVVVYMVHFALLELHTAGQQFRARFPHSSCSSFSCCLPSSTSSCSSSFSSSCKEEESLGQLTRWWAPSLAMWATSWGMRGTKFANATADFSSAQLRSLATPHVGTHSTLSLVGLYAMMLPSRACASFQ